MAQLILPVSRRDHVKGPRSAPVMLLEYGDYECPPIAAWPIRLSMTRAIAGRSSVLRFS